MPPKQKPTLNAADIDLLKETFSTKDDLSNFATKQDLSGFATKEDVEQTVSKAIAANNEILFEHSASKDDLNEQRQEMKDELSKFRNELQKNRRYASEGNP